MLSFNSVHVERRGFKGLNGRWDVLLGSKAGQPDGSVVIKFFALKVYLMEAGNPRVSLTVWPSALGLSCPAGDGLSRSDAAPPCPSKHWPWAGPRSDDPRAWKPLQTQEEREIRYQECIFHAGKPTLNLAETADTWSISALQISLCLYS